MIVASNSQFQLLQRGHTTSGQPKMETIPLALQEFLATNKLPVTLFTCTPNIPRFIRINPRTIHQTTIETLDQQLQTKVAVTALPQFRSFDANVQIADKEIYRDGSIYGMDLASGLSVIALNPQPNEHILDLCAAPGNKLAMIADLMTERTRTRMTCDESSSISDSTSPTSSVSSCSPLSCGSVTGVDWNYQRLAGARTMARKYQLIGNNSRIKSNPSDATPVPLPPVRFFLADGQTFHQPPPTNTRDLSDEGHIIDLTHQLSSSSSYGLASSTPYHCATASNSSHILSSDGSMLRVSKKQKRAMKKSLAREEWRKKQKIETADGNVDSIDTSSTTTTEESASVIPSSSPATSVVTAASPPPPTSDLLYDRVLVDAECTHDGSVKHMTKVIASSTNSTTTSTAPTETTTTASTSDDSVTSIASPSTTTDSTSFLSPERLSTLQLLQRNLLQNGFRQLKPGGTLVYSTCSYIQAQNEDIVRWLLEVESTAESVDVFHGLDKDWANIQRTIVPTAEEVNPADLNSSDTTSPPSIIRHDHTLLVTIETIRFDEHLPPLKFRHSRSTNHPATSTATNSCTLNSTNTASSIDLGIRLDPFLSGTSGLYIAKVMKSVDHSGRS